MKKAVSFNARFSVSYFVLEVHMFLSFKLMHLFFFPASLGWKLRKEENYPYSSFLGIWEQILREDCLTLNSVNRLYLKTYEHQVKSRTKNLAAEIFNIKHLQV